jgi:hypothetical protein
MATIARITVSRRNDDGIERITDMEEFSVREDPVKRRRQIMSKIGKIVDESTADDGPTSFTVIFNDIA